MTDLFLDLETFCAAPIKQGAHRYAEDAEVLLVAYAWDDEPVAVRDTADDWRSFHGPLQMMIDTADRVVIHNSAFDRTVLRHRGVHIPPEKVVDTMVLALQHSLPASLGQLCDVLGVPTDKAKDKDGKRLIHLFSKPRPKNVKIRRATRETHPDDWTAFIEYARLDVDAMRSVLGRLPRWNDSDVERRYWLLDQAANDRGVAVDHDLARSALRAFERTGRDLAAATARLTGGAVASTTQRDALLRYLRDHHDFTPGDLTGDTVTKLLAQPLSPTVRQLLEIRQQASATSPAKYSALLGAMSHDGRLRGTVQFCGAARTGRDAGRIFQPQNLPRTPDWFDEDVQEITVAAFKADAEDVLWPNISDRCSMAVRGCLVAAPGTKLVIADLSNIEGRVLAWLAGEQWKIEAFKAYDRGEGPDLYKVTAARILGKDVADVTKDERQNPGKVSELSSGYQGGVGAFRKMGGSRVEGMSDDEIQEIVWKWRAAHPRTKSLWYDMEGAAKMAIRAPGESFGVRDLIRFDVARDRRGDEWLRMRLPSGRFLCYLKPRIDDNSGQILYEGMNQFTRKWSVLETYGGKLVENSVQAIARDAFFSGFERAEAEGYPVVLRVHDELVCEVPDDPAYSHERLAEMMATNPSWTTGLPLAAEGFTTYRYRK